MRRLLLPLGLFLVTVVIVAIYLVVRIGPSRIGAAGTPCPQASAADYKRPFVPEQEIPDLCAATGMAPAQAVTFVLRRSIPLRTYIATEIVSDCRDRQAQLCTAQLGDAALESAIDARLDAVLPQSIQDAHDFTSADVATKLPFAWSGFVALKSDSAPYASLSFELPNGTPFTLRRIEEQYGVAPQQRTDPQGYLSLEYANAGPGYMSKITVLVNPTTSEARRITVSVTRQ